VATDAAWTDLLHALDAQHAELAAIVDQCTGDDWERPTRCEGWDVADVLLHLAATDEFANWTALGKLGNDEHGFLSDGDRQTVTVDDAAAAQVASDRAAGGVAIRERWHAASEAMRATFNAGDPHARVRWVSGKLSLHTLTATRLSECWIHTGDIALALGIDLPPTNRLQYIARLAWRTLPYAFARDNKEMAGPVALVLTGPDADTWYFEPDAPALTTIRGKAEEFCDVAARRVEPSATTLEGEGPDVENVLALVRTYAL
jgi:uncharacterized protein (TIGR03084 family)